MLQELQRIINLVIEAYTRIDTMRCECGYETRCGLQYRLHLSEELQTTDSYAA